MIGGSVRVLFVAAEAFPMAKTGGLADVAGSLPQALRGCGIDARVMMPAYPSAMQHVRDLTTVMHRDDVGGFGAVDILLGRTIRDDAPVWLVRSQRLFERPGGPYADEHGVPWPDLLERFALLCNAAAIFASDYPDWRPSVVHANDWHTALVPSLLLQRQAPAAGCLLTIHNAAYQGNASLEQLRSFGVPPEHLATLPTAARSFLGVGASHADRLNTVSPTYAKEIQTARFGCGLERLFTSRSHELDGILNGVDYTVWDPRHDGLIPARYDERDLAGKSACKAALMEEMRLDTASFAPLLGVVSRLSAQKGLDLLVRIADILVTSGARLVVLGQGEPELERGFRALAARYPRRVATNIRFDEALAHRIVAASDIFLMPSRFEPCGLNQMYSLRYGAVPVVSAVGGLADSVLDEGQRGIEPGLTTGFAMRRFNPTSLAVAIGKAMAVYPSRSLWQSLQRNGMHQDFSWTQAAQRYSALYTRLASSAA
jgi:starch synthase